MPEGFMSAPNCQTPQQWLDEGWKKKRIENMEKLEIAWRKRAEEDKKWAELEGKGKGKVGTPRERYKEMAKADERRMQVLNLF